MTAFFASAPKLAALALFVRVVIEAFAPITTDWQQIVSFIAIASMLLGSFAAIGQTNIKRLMAYSSIGHMGYALVGLAAGSEQGVQGVIVYIVIYMAMTLGAFAAILAMRRGGVMVEDIASLDRARPHQAGDGVSVRRRSSSRSPAFPPLAGFFAKYYVFLAAIQAGLYALAVIGVVASVVGAYYYLRIVKIMYFDEPEGAFEPLPVELGAVLGVSGVLMLGFRGRRRRRLSQPPASLRTVCSRMPFALGPKALAAGYRLADLRYDRVDQHRGSGLGDARRSRPALGGREGADRRSRPPRPAVADAEGQSRGKPAARAAEPKRRPPRRSALPAGSRSKAPSAPRLRRSRCQRRSTKRRRAGDRLALKWPNDVLFDGAKVAGILLEAASGPRGRSSLVIGIGVNVLPCARGSALSGDVACRLRRRHERGDAFRGALRCLGGIQKHCGTTGAASPPSATAG